MRKYLRVVVFSLVVLNVQSVFGQFKEWPVAPVFNKQISSSNQRILATSDTLSLPFFDDFSQSTYSVDMSLWEEGSDVYVSPSIGIIPPTINVATFDGWDGTGNPHNVESEESEIRTDSLVSKPINLDGLSNLDNVVFSFYWQQQGFGEIPEADDSLVVEFLSDDNVWVKQTNESLINSESNRNKDFQRISRHIREEQYLHEGFQFKIVSIGNPRGPFDAWHVDYIKLDRQEDLIIDNIKDVAISTYPTSIFKTYTMIPFEHFFAYPDTIMNEFHYYATSFFDGGVQPIADYQIIEQTTQDVIANGSTPTEFTELSGIFDQELYDYEAIDFNLFGPYSNRDSLYLVTEIALREGESFEGDINLVNDTVRFEFNIHNTLAYDDGSAEYVAGINQSSGELAVQFFTPVEDTLTHVDIYFPVVYPLPDISSIQLFILNSLSDQDSSILSIDEFSVSYPDSINNFFRYTLSEPIILSGEFYISMKQFTNDYIAIGLDKNTQSASKIFYKTETEWIQNNSENVSGSLMFRAIFADAVISENDSILSTRNIALEPINIFPNPANERLMIRGQFQNYTLYNLSGERILEGHSNSLDTREIPEGIYLLKVLSNGQAINKRVLISH